MDERTDDIAGEAGESWAAAALGDAGVELSVEIAHRTLTLAELWELRPGDVLDFMAPISAEVTLLAGGVAVARGELVDVGGALGMRVARLEAGNDSRR